MDSAQFAPMLAIAVILLFGASSQAEPKRLFFDNPIFLELSDQTVHAVRVQAQIRLSQGKLEAWLPETSDVLRLSRGGEAIDLFESRGQVYVLDQTHRLWALDKSKIRIYLNRVSRVLPQGMAWGMGFVAVNLLDHVYRGIPISFSNQIVVFGGSTAVFVGAVSVIALYVPHSSFFKIADTGADFFTILVARNVKAVTFVSSTNDYLVEYLTPSNPQWLSELPKSNAGVSCERWLSSLF